MEAKRKRVWIIDEGSQGHVVQSRGLLREIGRRLPVEVSEVKARFTVKQGWLKSLAKKALRAFPGEALFRATHELEGPLPAEAPDLMVSSGPRSLLALEYLSRRYGCPSVFVQGSIRVPAGAVTCILRPDEGESREDYIFIPLLFSEITPELLERTRQEHGIPAEAAKHPVLFVGESSEKIRFASADWQALADFVSRSWKRDGRTWRLSTSYRTTPEVEETLRRGIPPEALQEAVWYSQAPRRITRLFLSQADRVYVTLDSLTMVTEAVSSGLPVTVIQPAGFVFHPANTHHRYLQGLHQQGLISLLAAGSGEREGEAAGAATAMAATGGRTVLDYGRSLEQLFARIGWKP